MDGWPRVCSISSSWRMETKRLISETNNNRWWSQLSLLDFLSLRSPCSLYGQNASCGYNHEKRETIWMWNNLMNAVEYKSALRIQRMTNGPPSHFIAFTKNLWNITQLFRFELRIELLLTSPSIAYFINTDILDTFLTLYLFYILYSDLCFSREYDGTFCRFAAILYAIIAVKQQSV